MTGLRKRLPVLVAAFGLIASACTGTGGATSTPASPSAATSSTPASVEPSVAASPSAVAVAAPTSLLKAGELSNCVDIEYSPMEFYQPNDPNTPVGFDVETYQAVTKKLGLTEKIVSTAFDGLIPALTAGRCDLVWSALYINDTRTKVADAVPYFATSQVIMVPAGNPKGIKAEADLCGKSVSIQGGGLVQERITAASKKCTDGGAAAIKVQAYPKVADEYQQIVLGRVDAVWEIDTSVADFQLKNPGKYDVAYSIVGNDRYGIYYGKGKTDLGAALTAALKALKDDGTLA
ncbi:MAG TPA: transporter substrate-binding domain-containing protein, partial [Candidatus Limnocylindrales bacterium]|nr:transporter substrate-binding domain-containing protein [Candidatus Limnocylindrales bacterium]